MSTIRSQQKPSTFPETALLKAVAARANPHIHADDRTYKMSVLLLVSSLAQSFRGPLVPRRPERVRDSQGLMVDTDQFLRAGMYPFSVKRFTAYASPSKRQATLAWLVQGIPTVEGRSFLFQHITDVVTRQTSVEFTSLFCYRRRISKNPGLLRLAYLKTPLVWERWVYHDDPFLPTS